MDFFASAGACRCARHGLRGFRALGGVGGPASLALALARGRQDQESHRKSQATHKAVAMTATTAIATVISGKRAPTRRHMLGLRRDIGRSHLRTTHHVRQVAGHSLARGRSKSRARTVSAHRQVLTV